MILFSTCTKDKPMDTKPSFFDFLVWSHEDAKVVEEEYEGDVFKVTMRCPHCHKEWVE